MTPPAPLVVMADTRRNRFHVGDEAMLAANLQRLAVSVPELDVRVLGHAAGTAEISAVVAQARGVFISGGGNICASWPGLLEQRVQLLRAAAARGCRRFSGARRSGPS